MYWYKIKNMLIILFAVLNVFLASMIIISDKSAKRQEKAIDEAIISVLSKNGITAQGEALSGKKQSLAYYRIENKVEDSASFAMQIMKSDAEKGFDDVGNPCYISGSKVMYIKSGRFFMRDSAVPQTKQTEADAEAAKKFFSDAGFDLSQTQCRLSGDKVIFTFSIGGVPIFERQLYAKMFGGVISECGGNIIAVLAPEGNDTKELYGREALLRFLRDTEREKGVYSVNGISMGYWVVLGDDTVNFKYTEAIPAYAVETDKGNYYYYN